MIVKGRSNIQPFEAHPLRERSEGGSLPDCPNRLVIQWGDTGSLRELQVAQVAIAGDPKGYDEIPGQASRRLRVTPNTLDSPFYPKQIGRKSSILAVQRDSWPSRRTGIAFLSGISLLVRILLGIEAFPKHGQLTPKIGWARRPIDTLALKRFYVSHLRAGGDG